MQSGFIESSSALALAQPQLLIGLLLAHVLADFYFQPFTWVQQRKERHALSLPLYIHSLIHGILSAAVMLCLAEETSFSVVGISAAVVAVTHFKIDVIKSYCADTTRSFLVDQGAHLVVVVGVFLYATNQWAQALHLLQGIGMAQLAVILAYLAILKPSSIIIKQLLSPWSSEVVSSNARIAHPKEPLSIHIEAQQTLALAGQRIGYLERTLMLSFILLNQFAAVGFLIAAKSVFRFGDLTKHHDRKLTEYVLLGTFTSVAITLAIGLACAAVLGRLPVKV